MTECIVTPLYDHLLKSKLPSGSAENLNAIMNRKLEYELTPLEDILLRSIRNAEGRILLYHLFERRNEGEITKLKSEFPCPSKEFFTIQLKNEVQSKDTLEIYDQFLHAFKDFVQNEALYKALKVKFAPESKATKTLRGYLKNREGHVTLEFPCPITIDLKGNVNSFSTQHEAMVYVNQAVMLAKFIGIYMPKVKAELVSSRSDEIPSSLKGFIAFLEDKILRDADDDLFNPRLRSISFVNDLKAKTEFFLSHAGFLGSYEKLKTVKDILNYSFQETKDEGIFRLEILKAYFYAIAFMEEVRKEYASEDVDHKRELDDELENMKLRILSGYADEVVKEVMDKVEGKFKARKFSLRTQKKGDVEFDYEEVEDTIEDWIKFSTKKVDQFFEEAYELNVLGEFEPAYVVQKPIERIIVGLNADDMPPKMRFLSPSSPDPEGLMSDGEMFRSVKDYVAHALTTIFLGVEGESDISSNYAQCENIVLKNNFFETLQMFGHLIKGVEPNKVYKFDPPSRSSDMSNYVSSVLSAYVTLMSKKEIRDPIKNKAMISWANEKILEISKVMDMFQIKTREEIDKLYGFGIYPIALWSEDIMKEGKPVAKAYVLEFLAATVMEGVLDPGVKGDADFQKKSRAMESKQILNELDFKYTLKFMTLEISKRIKLEARILMNILQLTMKLLTDKITDNIKTIEEAYQIYKSDMKAIKRLNYFKTVMPMPEYKISLPSSASEKESLAFDPGSPTYLAYAENIGSPKYEPASPVYPFPESLPLHPKAELIPPRSEDLKVEKAIALTAKLPEISEELEKKFDEMEDLKDEEEEDKQEEEEDQEQFEYEESAKTDEDDAYEKEYVEKYLTKKEPKKPKTLRERIEAMIEE